MERMFHKVNITYNTDQVDDKIGLDKEHFTVDQVDVFVERISKKIGWAVASYKEYENGKEIEKQFVTAFYNSKDIDEFLKKCFIKKTIIHNIDYSQTYTYIHADKKEKNFIDVIYVEYSDGHPKRGKIRVPRRDRYTIERMILDYRSKDPRRNKPFDGYYRDPSDMPKRVPRKIRRMEKEANSLPMPEPKVTLTMVAKGIAKDIKDYTIEKIGLNREQEDSNTINDSHHHRR